MATMLLDALLNEGNHDISTINSSFAKPVVNGAILTGANIDNGLLVEENGYDSEGNLQVKPYTGTAGVVWHIIQTVEEEQLQVDLGETDYKNFYNKVGEVVKLVRHELGLRQETSAYSLDTGVTLALGLPVVYDTASKKFKVVSTVGAQTQIAKVVGIDTDFGYNAGKTTIRIEYIL